MHISKTLTTIGKSSHEEHSTNQRTIIHHFLTKTKHSQSNPWEAEQCVENAFKTTKVRSAVYLPTSSYCRCPKRPGKNGKPFFYCLPAACFRGWKLMNFLLSTGKMVFSRYIMSTILWRVRCLFVTNPFLLKGCFFVDELNWPSPTSSIRVGIHLPYQSPARKKVC